MLKKGCEMQKDIFPLMSDSACTYLYMYNILYHYLQMFQMKSHINHQKKMPITRIKIEITVSMKTTNQIRITTEEDKTATIIMERQKNPALDHPSLAILPNRLLRIIYLYSYCYCLLL